MFIFIVHHMPTVVGLTMTLGGILLSLKLQIEMLMNWKLS